MGCYLYSMNYLSQTVESIAEYFLAEESDWAREELQKFCEYSSEFISDKTTPESYERFCSAVLKIVRTSKEKFFRAMELGNCDYRDLPVEAGFGNSVTVHEEWANSVSNKNT